MYKYEKAGFGFCGFIIMRLWWAVVRPWRDGASLVCCLVLSLLSTAGSGSRLFPPVAILNPYSALVVKIHAHARGGSSHLPPHSFSAAAPRASEMNRVWVLAPCGRRAHAAPSLARLKAYLADVPPVHILALRAALVAHVPILRQSPLIRNSTNAETEDARALTQQIPLSFSFESAILARPGWALKQSSSLHLQLCDDQNRKQSAGVVSSECAPTTRTHLCNAMVPGAAAMPWCS
jgi:hypothetical protein